MQGMNMENNSLGSITSLKPVVKPVRYINADEAPYITAVTQTIIKYSFTLIIIEKNINLMK